MEYLKTIIKNKKLIGQLGKNDFRNRFASTSLGSIWGFLQPFVFMFTYVIVFQYILKVPAAGNDPYAVWFLPGMAMWQTINEIVLNATNSIRNYSYLVKKVVFPVDIIPIISIVASSFVALFLFLVAIGVGCFYGYIPNFIQVFYILIATYSFLIAFTRFTSAVATLVPDFAQLLNILMQLFMWFTPIVWNLSMIDGNQFLSVFFRCMPFTYLVSGFRDAFIQGNIITQNNGIYTIVFWSITIIIFLWGNYIFKKNKKDFADVL